MSRPHSRSPGDPSGVISRFVEARSADDRILAAFLSGSRAALDRLISQRLDALSQERV